MKRDDPTEPSRGQLAEDRTDLAEDRTLLANERTFAGWARTAFASIGLGLGFHAIFRKVEPTWAAKLVATVFVLSGILLIWKARGRAEEVHRKLRQHEVESAPAANYRWLATATAAGGALLLLALWLLF